jgi:hypothetical protein
MVKCGVLFEVRTEFLNTIKVSVISRDHKHLETKKIFIYFTEYILGVHKNGTYLCRATEHALELREGFLFETLN